MITFFKKKLGIDKLEAQTKVLLKENADLKHKLNIEVPLAIKIADEFRQAQIKLTEGQIKNSVKAVHNKIDKVAALVNKELADRTRITDQKIENLSAGFSKRITSLDQVNTNKLNNLIKIIGELTITAKDLTTVTENELKKFERSMQGKMWIQTGNFFEKTETEIVYNLTVLDKNYIRALLQNKLTNIYNSSDIRHIPNNYSTYFNNTFKQVGVGMQNRHCYDNALLFGRERNEAIHIGIIIPKLLLEKAFNKTEEPIQIIPYLHAWNMTSDRLITDYTLGHKRGLEFVYIGRPLGAINDISAKGLEEILRKETI